MPRSTWMGKTFPELESQLKLLAGSNIDMARPLALPRTLRKEGRKEGRKEERKDMKEGYEGRIRRNDMKEGYEGRKDG